MRDVESELPEQPQENQKKAPLRLSVKQLLSKKVLLLGTMLIVVLSMGTYIIISPSHDQVVITPTPTTIPTPTIISPILTNELTPTPQTVAPTVTPSPTPTAVPFPTLIPAVSWKTYTNAKYGYSIKYSPDWIVRDLGILEPKIPSYIVFNQATASGSARSITISITTRTYQEQLALAASSSAITVAGVKGTKQYFQDSDGNVSTVIILPKTDDVLVLRAKTKYLTIFDFMLSTLKITN